MTVSVVTNDVFHDRAGRARAFLAHQEYPLGVALIDHALGAAPGTSVVDALMPYRNADGGFGNGLEVDIAAPESNPFATRLAMQALVTLQDDAAQRLLPSLQQWLVANQAADGDWHLSSATRARQLAPWFAAWEHPALNPACCVAGLANRLGVATPVMLERTASLFAARAAVDDVATGSFYELLPYAEYLTAVNTIPDHDAYLDAFASRIMSSAEDIFTDASHFWDLVLALGDAMTERLPDDLMSAWALRLLDEQESDGGWPSPYSPAWRPWLTATCVLTLATLSGSIDD